MKKSILLLFIGAISLSACKDKKAKSIATETPTFSKEASLTFINQAQDTLATFAIELAKSSYEKQTGLMYRKSMEDNQGMLFVYPDEQARPGFYMKNTYIPLDLIYINAKNTMVDFNLNAQAFDETPLPSTTPAKYVLEVNAGTVHRLGLTLGDKIHLNTLP